MREREGATPAEHEAEVVGRCTCRIAPRDAHQRCNAGPRASAANALQTLLNENPVVVVELHNVGDGAERDEIQHFIMDELVPGIRSAEAVACFQRVFDRMKGEGCDAVVLGCTEIPLIVDDANSALPTLDSTRLLARAALRRAAIS